MAEKRKITIESVAYKQQNTGDSSHSNFVRVKFVNQDDVETYFKVVRNAKLSKAFTAYTRHHKLDHQLHFTYNGLRVNPNHTADDLNIRDGDIFDVFGYVSGGGCIQFYGTAIPFSVVSTASSISC